MSKPRPAQLVTWFQAGASIDELVWKYRYDDVYRHDIEKAIRQVLNRKRSKSK